MKEKLSPAVDALLEKLKEQEAGVKTTKAMINQLRSMMKEEQLFIDVDSGTSSIGPTRPDQYYGKAPTIAAEEFLGRRGQACSAEEIQRGLEQGGFDFSAMGWKPKDRVRMIAITLAKNPQKFHKLPNGTFGLLVWYPMAKRPEKPVATSVPAPTNDGTATAVEETGK